MITWVREWLELRRLRRQERKVIKAYEAELAAPRTPGATRHDIESRRAFELSQFEDEREIIATKRLFRKANRLDVPVILPENSWRNSQWSFDNYLSVIGIKALKDQIRAEQAARWSERERWGKLLGGMITAATGLCGSVIGLISLLK